MNSSCIISNLPISYNEKVKLIILYKPYERDFFCYPNYIYSPAFLPLSCRYDDHGYPHDKFNKNQKNNLNIINKTLRDIFDYYIIDNNEYKDKSIDIKDFIFNRQDENIQIKLKEYNDDFSLIDTLKNQKILYENPFTFCYIKENVWNEIVANYNLSSFYDNTIRSIKFNMQFKRDTTNLIQNFYLDIYNNFGGQSCFPLSYNYSVDYFNNGNDWLDKFIELYKIDSFMDDLNLMWRESSISSNIDDVINSNILYLKIINSKFPKSKRLF
jgi:hypothetical protein